MKPNFVPMEVELIDTMGSDMTVVNSARVSFNKTSDYSPDGSMKEADEKLIKYLAEHNHWSPFAHCSLQFRIKAPVFVARQLVKHQIGLSWNEVSRRYVAGDVEFYKPEKWRAKDENAKQGSKQDEYIDYIGHSDYHEFVIHINDWYHDITEVALQNYDRLLKDGVAPEMARMVLPLSHMTEWYWSGSLYAFARICNLRIDPHAQHETALVASRIYQETEKEFPISWKYLMVEK
tara:strand:- start:1990 stop:2691 length:702 start_codon:yes stop_codon:yes gene_type:complete